MTASSESVGFEHGAPEHGARQRILETAYELFARHGIQAVGVDEVIRRSSVAKATLYKHFPSKDELVIAFLDLREQRWTLEWLEREAERRGATPEERLLAMFDLLDEWFQREDYEACSFINTLLELRASHPVGKASAAHLENTRTIVRRLAKQAGLREPASFARSWHILMKGAIIAAAEGDLKAARQAQTMARMLIAEHRP